jgi:hypothetical protein
MIKSHAIAGSRGRYRDRVIAALGVGIVVLVLAATTAVLRKRGYSGMGGNTIVRCRKGHLFTTIWVPGASFKAIRLGWARYQRCPVGPHWTLVTPVKDASLTDEERAEAAAHRDLRIP